MRRQCHDWVKSCAICQRLGQTHENVKLNPIVIDATFHVIVVSSIGPLPCEGKGNKSIFSVIDSRIRYAVMGVATHSDAQSVGRSLRYIWVQQRGAP